MIVFTLLATAFLALTILDNRRKGVKGSVFCSSPSLLMLAYPLVGLILALEIVMINLAYTHAIVPYVISIKRLAIVFSVVFGILFFGEQSGLGRITGAIIMVAGAGVIAILG